MARNEKKVPDVDQLLRRVRYDHGCWLWTGGLSLGYGYAGGKGVHRLVYEALAGPIPRGKQLDHLCRTRACCNPLHLEPVTPGTNLDRGGGRLRWGAVSRRAAQKHALTVAKQSTTVENQRG